MLGVSSRWQIQDQTVTVLNSSSPTPKHHISTQNIQSLEGRLSNSCRGYSDARVIDGVDTTLDAMEKVPVDDKYRPLDEFRLRSVTIHANPIAERQDV